MEEEVGLVDAMLKGSSSSCDYLGPYLQLVNLDITYVSSSSVWSYSPRRSRPIGIGLNILGLWNDALNIPY